MKWIFSTVSEVHVRTMTWQGGWHPWEVNNLNFDSLFFLAAKLHFLEFHKILLTSKGQILLIPNSQIDLTLHSKLIIPCMMTIYMAGQQHHCLSINTISMQTNGNKTAFNLFHFLPLFLAMSSPFRRSNSHQRVKCQTQRWWHLVQWWCRRG